MFVAERVRLVGEHSRLKSKVNKSLLNTFFSDCSIKYIGNNIELVPTLIIEKYIMG